MPLHYSLVWLIKSPLKDQRGKERGEPRGGRTPGHSFCFPDLGSKRSSPAAGTILVRASPFAHTLPSGVGKEGSVPAMLWSPQAPHSVRRRLPPDRGMEARFREAV